MTFSLFGPKRDPMERAKKEVEGAITDHRSRITSFAHRQYQLAPLSQKYRILADQTQDEDLRNHFLKKAANQEEVEHQVAEMNESLEAKDADIELQASIVEVAWQKGPRRWTVISDSIIAAFRTAMGFTVANAGWIYMTCVVISCANFFIFSMPHATISSTVLFIAALGILSGVALTLDRGTIPATLGLITATIFYTSFYLAIGRGPNLFRMEVKDGQVIQAIQPDDFFMNAPVYGSSAVSLRMHTDWWYVERDCALDNQPGKLKVSFSFTLNSSEPQKLVQIGNDGVAQEEAAKTVATIVDDFLATSNGSPDLDALAKRVKEARGTEVYVRKGKITVNWTATNSSLSRTVVIG
jgi:hypothetical protein